MRPAMANQDSIAMKYPLLTQAIDRPIALVGMMGSGKSLVGRRLARSLGCPLSTATPKSRRLPASASRKSSNLRVSPNSDPWSRRPSRPPPMPALRSCRPVAGPSARRKQPIFCARAHACGLAGREPETLLSRIGSVGSRPLLHTDDPLQTLRELAETRQADYGRAHITVKTDRLSAAAAVNAVLDALDSHLRKHSSGLL